MSQDAPFKIKCYPCLRNGPRAFAGQEVGIKEVEDGIWVVSFLDYDLGYFDEVAKRVEPVDDPFKIKVLPMSPE